MKNETRSEITYLFCLNCAVFLSSAWKMLAWQLVTAQSDIFAASQAVTLATDILVTVLVYSPYPSFPPPPPPTHTRVNCSALEWDCRWVQTLFNTRRLMAARRSVWYTCTVPLEEIVNSVTEKNIERVRWSRIISAFSVSTPWAAVTLWVTRLEPPTYGMVPSSTRVTVRLVVCLSGTVL